MVGPLLCSYNFSPLTSFRAPHLHVLSAGWSHAREFGYLKSFEIPAVKPRSCLPARSSPNFYHTDLKVNSQPGGASRRRRGDLLKRIRVEGAFGNFRFEPVSRLVDARIPRRSGNLDTTSLIHVIFFWSVSPPRDRFRTSFHTHTLSARRYFTHTGYVFDRKLGLHNRSNDSRCV